MRSIAGAWSVNSARDRANRDDQHVPGQEVSQVVEVAVLLVLDVHDAPAVLAAPDRLTVDHDVPFRPDDRERHHALREKETQDTSVKEEVEVDSVRRTRIAWFSCRSSASFSSVSKGYTRISLCASSARICRHHID